jgi:hypothetical protein
VFAPTLFKFWKGDPDVASGSLPTTRIFEEGRFDAIDVSTCFSICFKALNFAEELLRFASQEGLMSQKQATNICFYSNRCQWSKAFIQELAPTPWKGEFRFICVDPSPQRPKLPEWLKKVPTLVIAGEPEPRTGGDVMNWLYERKMAEAATTSSKQAASPDGTPGGEPSGWNMFENTSFNRSFGYSFNTSDTSTGGEGGLTIPGTFSFLGGAASTGDRTAQEFPGGGGGGAAAAQSSRSRSKKEEIFDKQMEVYQKSREDGIPKGMPRQ